MEDEGRRPLRLRRPRGAEQARQEAVLQRAKTRREKKTRISQDSFVIKIFFISARQRKCTKNSSRGRRSPSCRGETRATQPGIANRR